MSKNKELMDIINKELDVCCPKSLPDLKAMIDLNGKEAIAELVYNICANEGLSVQSAMAQLDSE